MDILDKISPAERKRQEVKRGPWDSSWLGPGLRKRFSGVLSVPVGESGS